MSCNFSLFIRSLFQFLQDKIKVPPARYKSFFKTKQLNRLYHAGDLSFRCREIVRPEKRSSQIN